MKKILVLALVVVAVFAFATSAYAGTTSGYETWDASAPNDNPATPHKGYALNTNKCAVCHAVHKGTDGGEVLLNSTVADACSYCHIDATAVTDRIYGGDTTNLGPADNDMAHNIGCSPCHSVHGAETIDGNVSGFILKDWDYSGWSREYSTYAQADFPNPDAGTVNQQETNFCTGCHKYYTPYYADGSATGYVTYGGAGNVGDTGSYQSHIMTSPAPATYGGAGTFTGQAAWAASPDCRSCHDSPNDGLAISISSFPHYSQNYYRFMVSGGYTGDSSTNTTGTVDGLCLKCHINAGQTAGAGITF